MIQKLRSLGFQRLGEVQPGESPWRRDESATATGVPGSALYVVVAPERFEVRAVDGAERAEVVWSDPTAERIDAAIAAVVVLSEAARYQARAEEFGGPLPGVTLDGKEVKPERVVQEIEKCFKAGRK